MITIPANKEHYYKYKLLFEAKGEPSHLIDIISIRIGRDAIIKALEEKDYHLNSIKLSIWDGLAQNVGWTSRDGDKKMKSLAEQVCLLKHIAIYQIAEAQPKFKD